MQFIDPFEFLEISPTEAIPAEELKRARSRMLAQFELEETTTLSFKNIEIDRQRALALIDELNDPAIVRHYFELTERPALKKFLETASRQYVDQIPEPQEVSGQEFRAWISPFFAHSLRICLQGCISGNVFTHVLLLVNKAEFLQVKDYPQGFQPLEKFVAEAEQSAKMSPALESGDFSLAIGQLPPVYDNLNHKYAEILLKNAEHQYRQQKPGVAKSLLANTDDLRVSPHLQKRIDQVWSQVLEAEKAQEKIRDQAYARYREAGKGNKRPIFAWIVVVVTIFGLIFTFVELDKRKKDGPPTSGDFRDELKRSLRNRLFFNHLAMTGIVDLGFGNDPADTIRPETGFQPYAAALSYSPACRDKCTEVKIYNNSRRDGVIFMQEMDGTEEIIRHRYVRHGEKLELEPVGPNFYSIVWYSGRAWKPESFDYENKKFGSFYRDISEPWDSDSLVGKTWIPMNTERATAGREVIIENDTIYSQ